MDKTVREAIDRDLVVSAQRGGVDAFESIVRGRLESCYATCLSILGSPDDARDATQDAFVVAWRRLPMLRDPDRFDGWLHAIAVNASRDVLRRRRRLREVAIEDGMGGVTEPPTDSRADLEAAVGRLPPGGREVAQRFYLDDEPIREISASLGVPVGTIKSRLFHARTALRALLAKE
jgi:RNA polymerase sigma-70 factor, ECF subfamily